MKRLKPARSIAVVLGLLAGCGGTVPELEGCGGGIGLGVPPCTCTSWRNVVIPTGETARSSSDVLVPDWSTSPPQAVIGVGVRFSVTATVIQERPFDCNQGATSNELSWSASDAAVLAFEGKGPHPRNAMFRATAPGTAQVAANQLLAPGGSRTWAELSTCNRGATGSLQDGYICADRVPLVIRVVPEEPTTALGGQAGGDARATISRMRAP